MLMRLTSFRLISRSIIQWKLHRLLISRWIKVSLYSFTIFVASFFTLTFVMDGYLQVIFMNPAPMHPHIYSNGHICLGMLFTLCFRGEHILRYQSFPNLYLSLSS